MCCKSGELRDDFGVQQQEPSKEFILKITVLLASLMLFSEAFANNLFIPNSYRSRREQNEFSALGWSERKEANLQYGTGTGEEDDGTTATDQDTSALEGEVFYRMNDTTNVEFVYEDNQVKPDGGSTAKVSGWDLGVGHQFNDQMALGLSYESGNRDNGTTDFDTTTYSVGFGYKLDNNWFLGLGYRNSEDDVTGDPTKSTTALGAGYVWGDAKKPTANFEVAYLMFGGDYSGGDIVARGLYNYGQGQYFAAVTMKGEKDETGATETETTGTEMQLGVDYHVTDAWYVAPAITMNNTENDDAGTEDTTNNMSLEVGYRQQAAWEAFFRYDNNKTEDGAGGNTETTGTVMTVGGTYFF